MPGLHFAAEKFPDAGEMLLGGHARLDRGAARRQLVENGDVKITIKCERKRARDGRGSEDEDVRGVAMRRGFVHQALALQDAEAVLLVDGDKAKAGELDIVLDERVGANDELGFGGTNALQRSGFFCAFQAADEQLGAIPAGSENAARGKKMLDGKNFRGRHESGLERNDGFAAADIALEKAIHGRGLLKVRGDFREDALLRSGGLERKNAFERFAHAVFANAEGDGVFFAGGLAVERETELIEKKFFEDQALLRGRAKGVERI